MTDTTARLAATPKLDEDTGLPDDTADALYHRLDHHIMAVVELHVTERADKADGTRTVKLAVHHLELDDAEPTQTLLRDLARAIYSARTPGPLDPDYPIEAVQDAVRRIGNTILRDEAATP